jgi:DNA-binding phage protein
LILVIFDEYLVMASITFDTHEFVKKLKSAVFSESQAEAVAEAQRDSLAQALDSQLATKADISRLELKLIEHEGEFKLIKWMLGIILGGVIALVLKAFFPIV